MLSLSGDSVGVLISAFELALFNRHVQKSLKSGTLMEQRQVLFDFFHVNSTLLHQRIEEASQLESQVAEG